jgi:hypothetical protein
MPAACLLTAFSVMNSRCDRGVGASLGHQREHFAFPRRQPGHRLGAGVPSSPLTDCTPNQLPGPSSNIAIRNAKSIAAGSFRGAYFRAMVPS